MDKKTAEDKRHLFAIIYCNSKSIGRVEGDPYGTLVTLLDANLEWDGDKPTIAAAYWLVGVDHPRRGDPSSWFTFPKTFVGIPVTYAHFGARS